MHRFQSNKPKKQRAADGFLSSDPRRPKIDSQPQKTSGPVFRSRPMRLDDFNKTDGFRGMTAPQLNSSGALINPSRVVGTGRLTGRRRSPNLPPYSVNRAPAKTRKKSLGVLKRAAIVFLVLILGTSGFLFGKAWWSAHKVFKGGGTALAFNTNIDPHLLNGEGDGRVNILLLGKGGATEQAGGELTDSMMIASIDPVNTKLTLLSIPRDLWVKPQGLWSMKINAVYVSAKNKALASNPKNTDAAEKAGIAASEAVVEQYLGVHMNYYAMIDFSAFQEAVNTLGGIDVTLPEAYSDYTMLVGNKYLNLPAGAQHLDGGMALAYARSRHGALRGDFDRGEHQQIVIVGIRDKVISLGTMANPLKISQLLGTFGNRIRTNLSVDDMIRVYNISKKLGPNDIGHADLAQESNAVVTTGNINGQSVVIPKAGVDNYDAVRAFVRTQLKDGFLVKENASIIVLNGTHNINAAQKRADELRGYGYNVTQVADAPVKNATATQLVDNTKGVKKYTKRYLEQRLGVKAVGSVSNMDMSPYKADFIIIVGS